MYRILYENLKKWHSSDVRKPLVLFGARQVGKTWLLKEFGKKEYAKTAFVSFDRDKSALQLMQILPPFFILLNYHRTKIRGELPFLLSNLSVVNGGCMA